MNVLLVALLVTVYSLDECGRLNEYNENTGHTALHRAAILLDIKCIQYLLDMGADPNAVTLKVNHFAYLAG